MHLVVLTYRLTKIKGVLVSVGICALSNATLYIGSVAISAALALSFSTAAMAGGVPGCNSATGDGFIGSSSGSSLLWTAPAICVVTAGATVEKVNGTALTASDPSKTHTSLTNNGYLHSSLSGTALHLATIAGLSNLVNVGTISNVTGATITGDYLPGVVVVPPPVVPALVPALVSSDALAGPGNTFNIYGVDNHANAVIGTFSNAGTIQGTIDSGIDVNTVAQGVVVGFNNDGTLTALSNSGVIRAGLGASVSTQSNVFTVVGLKNSAQIGALTNSGSISGNFGILNGSVDSLGAPYDLPASSATIGQLVNTGTISGTAIGIASGGHIDTVTNSGLIQGGYAAVMTGTASSIGLIDNSGSIFSLVNNGPGATMVF